MTAHSIRAEEGVIGACMIDERVYWRVADVLTEADFFDVRCRSLFDLIGGLLKAGRPVDAVTIGDLIRSRNLPDAADLIGYVIDVADATPSSANARTYAEIVAAKATQRRVADAGTRIARLTGDDAFPEAQAILAAVQTRQSSVTKSVKAAIGDLVKLMASQAERDGSLLGVTTGIAGLDALTCGLCAKDLVIVAGRPSMGKTVLGLGLATASAKAGHPAHVITLEMSTSQCLQRIISAESSIPHDAIRDAKKIQEEHWHRLTIASEAVGEFPLFFDDAVRDFASLIARITQVHATHGTRIIVIDYLSHIPPPKAERHDLALQEITRALKALAKRLDITVVLICQLNRGVEGRADKRPVLSDLRESGAIEQDADVVLMPYRDEYYNADSPHRGYAEILIRKQRNGELGSVPVRAELTFQRFVDAPDGLPSMPAIEHKPRERGFGRVRSIGLDRRAGND